MKMDERNFVETLRNDIPEVLRKEMKSAIKDFAQKTLDANLSAVTEYDIQSIKEYKKSKEAVRHLSKIPYSLKVFLTTFKKHSKKMPIDVVFEESNYEYASGFVSAVDNLCAYLDKKGNDTSEIKNKSTFGKLELGAILIESKVDLLDSFEKTMTQYQGKCERVYDNLSKTTKEKAMLAEAA